MKLKDFSKIYFAILFVHLAALYAGQDPKLIGFSKPLIVFSLAAFFWHKMADEALALTKNRYFFAGLLFFIAGDVASLYSYRHAFYISMGLFAGALLCYTRSFLGDADLKTGFLKKQPVLILLPLLAGAAALWHLWPNLENERWGVVFYFVTLSATFLSTINRYGRTQNKPFFFGILGAFLFMISHFLLAQHTFAVPLPQSKIWIMGIYGLAQFGLVMGRVGVN